MQLETGQIEMSQSNILNEFNNLPPEAQKQVLDFISFLQTRYQSIAIKKVKPETKLIDESFIGIWRKRKNMRESSAWVGKVRSAEWG